MEKNYRYEMHCHSGEFGWCAKVDAKDFIPAYAALGYSGVCVTNHYFDFGFMQMPERAWSGKIKHYLRGYHAALEAAAPLGLDVILGLEIRFEEGPPNDFLLYGMDEDFLYAYPELYRYRPQAFKKFAEEHGLIFFQAHPFRRHCQPVPPKWVHGYEVSNLNPRQNSQNELALALQQQSGLLGIGGSDFHQMEDLGRGGCLFRRRIKDGFELVREFRAQMQTPETPLWEVNR